MYVTVNGLRHFNRKLRNKAFLQQNKLFYVKPQHENTEADQKLKTLVVFCVKYAKNANTENRQFAFSHFKCSFEDIKNV